MGILKADKIQHTVQADGIDALAGVGLDTGLGVESDAQARFVESVWAISRRRSALRRPSTTSPRYRPVSLPSSPTSSSLA